MKGEDIVEIKVREFSVQKLKNFPWKLVVIKEDAGREITTLRGRINEEDLPKVVELLVKSGERILSVEQKEPTLKDVFIKPTGRALRD